MQALRNISAEFLRSKQWVFGVGLSKTATTSLNDALEILGYRSIHLPPINQFDPEGRVSLSWPWWLNKFNAATDLSVAVMHRELRAKYPKAKFIYTTRDLDCWLDSCRRHFTEELAIRRVRQKNFWLLELTSSFYGSFLFDEELYKSAFLRHDQGVRSSLSADEMLVWDFTTKPSWDGLCQFLGKPLPDAPFPKSNVGRSVKPSLQT